MRCFNFRTSVSKIRFVLQTKVQEEIDGLIGNRNPTLEDIPMLPHTEAALAETQRIRSVVPVGIPHGSLEVSFLVKDVTLGNPL